MRIGKLHNLVLYQNGGGYLVSGEDSFPHDETQMEITTKEKVVSSSPTHPLFSHSVLLSHDAQNMMTNSQVDGYSVTSNRRLEVTS